MIKQAIIGLWIILTPMAFAQGDPVAGKAKSATCVACHGADGNGIAPNYPKIAGQNYAYLVKQLKAFRLGAQTQGEQGRYEPQMSPMAAPLSDQDIDDLAAYYASLSASPNTTPSNVIELGQTLYRSGDAARGIPACMACHGPRGDGLRMAVFPKLSQQYAEYIQSQLEAFRAGERHDDMNGMMQDVARNLTDEEIQALAYYVGGLH
ncbi:Cytochrome c4 [Vibrio stylophorae]|uniref:Cytochrome c4 n=1 Tax=Vibrio stylophorae TaxID=659351 RepID=A0ABM8ZPT5_9VIBR|nr:c-type cytochrome [Vibrio stylophorae]CAH0532314.1 Cytochrome c4 [Vibrio stylophorae]